jgi:hypothetical protein
MTKLASKLLLSFAIGASGCAIEGPAETSPEVELEDDAGLEIEGEAADPEVWIFEWKKQFLKSDVYYYSNKKDAPGGFSGGARKFKLFKKGGRTRTPARRCRKVGEERVLGGKGYGIDSFFDSATFWYKDGDPIVTLHACPSGFRNDGVIGFVALQPGKGVVPLWEARNSNFAGQKLSTKKDDIIKEPQIISEWLVARDPVSKKILPFAWAPK